MAYTTVNDPSAYFQTTIYTGNGSTQNITNTGNSNLRPDWIWFKNRTNSPRDHVLIDSTRGVDLSLYSNQDSADQSLTDVVSSLNTDGFSLEANARSNENSANQVAWQWAAGGATPSKTYRVVVVSDGGNKYRFRNSTNTATFAQSAVTLELQSGGTYTFDLSDSSVDGHPMKFSTTSNGTHGGGTVYSTGVTYKLDGSTVTESAYVSGFNAATTRQIILNVQNTTTLYYFCHYHSGMGGQADQNSTFGQTNFDGSILSRSNENATSGFSIVRHAGSGSAGTIGHGLGAVPQVIITKNRSASADWAVYDAGIGNQYYLRLNTDDYKATASSVWGDTTPTALSFTVGGANTKNNSSGNNFVSYCFRSIKGFSKMGAYTGNGNSDGTFVYTGFKPAWVMFKRTNGSNDWLVFDNKRSPFNLTEKVLYPNSNGAEQDDSQHSGSLDLLSNGFKLRETGNSGNGNGALYFYMAFAESPFVATNNVVATAR